MKFRLAGLVLCAVAAGAVHAFQPGGSAISTATVQVAFTPGENADEMIIEAIGKARRQILVQAFSFTHRKIARALIAARKNGVDVQLIADQAQTERIRNSAIPQLAAAGVPVFLDARHEAAHNKVMVMDAGEAGAAVITGSYNFTHAAQFTNAENVLWLRGAPQLAQAYYDNWQRHRAHSLPYSPRR